MRYDFYLLVWSNSVTQGRLTRFAAVAVFLLFAGSACKGCQDEYASDFFQPTTFGEFEFDGEPDIAGPERLLIDALDAGETGTVTAEIRNDGRETLKINEWSISDGFELSFTGSLRGPDELRPGESVIIGVSFTAPDDDEHRGVLAIDSNDPDEPRFVVDIFVNGKFPCLETVPDDVLDFGEVEQDERLDRTLIVRNCSTNAATTFEVLGIEGDAEFTIVRGLGGEAVTLQVGQSVELVLGFQPRDAGTYTARIGLVSDDEFRPEHAVELRGTGAEGAPPIAIIEGTSSVSGEFRAAPNDTLDTIPLDRLRMYDDSEAFDGKLIDEREWTLTTRPTDSAAAFSNAADAPEQELFLDLAGTYVVELRVWDTEGVQSATTARLTIHAVADEDIHIQLVWDTPNDANQNDQSGSDVDLHLLHPNASGTWNDNPWDCFWQNLIPDWGTSRPAGVDSFDCQDNPNRPGCHDDPSLDIDDVDGWGPENINLNNPELDTDYEVGIHYFSDHGYSVSFATVRIFIGGVLRAEYRRQRLMDQEFWHVAQIAWPTGAILPRGQVYPSFP